MKKHYLLVSDFDQTLSFNDSGIILSDAHAGHRSARHPGRTRVAQSIRGPSGDPLTRPATI
jgi:2-hydroxy-3-keto-5-methylthiopentenyl-1-phosphate phosphatase